MQSQQMIQALLRNLPKKLHNYSVEARLDYKRLGTKWYVTGKGAKHYLFACVLVSDILIVTSKFSIRTVYDKLLEARKQIIAKHNYNLIVKKIKQLKRNARNKKYN